MNSNKVTTISVVAVVAASLLAVGIVTVLSMVEQADAALKLNINRNSAVASANGANGANGGSGANGQNGANGGVAASTINQGD